MNTNRNPVISVFCVVLCWLPLSASEVQPLSKSDAETYQLDPRFHQKSLRVHGILIATSGRVADHTLRETAYQFSQIMSRLDPAVAQRIREEKVLCILVAHDELTSDVPQFKSNKTGRDLDFYNWRQRGFLTRLGGRMAVFFAEEDVMEYAGGMQIESILIHEFGHVIDFAGLSEAQREKVTQAYEQAIKKVSGMMVGRRNDSAASKAISPSSYSTPSPNPFLINPPGC